MLWTYFRIVTFPFPLPETEEDFSEILVGTEHPYQPWPHLVLGPRRFFLPPSIYLYVCPHTLKPHSSKKSHY